MTRRRSSRTLADHATREAQDARREKQRRSRPDHSYSTRTRRAAKSPTQHYDATSGDGSARRQAKKSIGHVDRLQRDSSQPRFQRPHQRQAQQPHRPRQAQQQFQRPQAQLRPRPQFIHDDQDDTSPQRRPQPQPRQPRRPQPQQRAHPTAQASVNHTAARRTRSTGVTSRVGEADEPNTRGIHNNT